MSLLLLLPPSPCEDLAPPVMLPTLLPSATAKWGDKRDEDAAMVMAVELLLLALPVAAAVRPLEDDVEDP